MSFALDTRILNVDWRNNEMVVAQNVGINSDMDTHARWYEISTAGGVPSMMQQGTINPGPGIDTYMPSVALAPDGTIGMTYMESAAGVEDMSMYVTGRAPSDPLGTMDVGVKVSPEPDPNQQYYYQGSRIGDFSGITVDPSYPTKFWAVNEYALAVDPLNITFPNWGTWIASFDITSGGSAMGTPAAVGGQAVPNKPTASTASLMQRLEALNTVGWSRGRPLLDFRSIIGGGQSKGNGSNSGSGPLGGSGPQGPSGPSSFVSTGINFKGLDANVESGTVEPPDPIAAAGPTAIVEEVNSHIAFYSKSTGQLLVDPPQGLDQFFAPVDQIDFLLSDEPLIDNMKASLLANNYRFTPLVEAIVASPQFRNKRVAWASGPRSAQKGN